jgi:hypothetical protein
MSPAEQHARRLVRFYPRSWRDRYGDELAALIIDDLTDQPRSLWRDLDVVRAGLAARLSACGIARGPVRDRSATTAAAAAGAVVFVASALSIWTQLADGWLASSPDTVAVTVGLVTLSLWFGGLGVVTAVVGARTARSAVRAARAGHGSEVLRPLSWLLASAGVLIVGTRLMAPRWPGAARPQHGGILASVARYTWAATDTISTFWLHPYRLVQLPLGELFWMAVSPAAAVVLVWATIRVAQTGRQGGQLRVPRMTTRAGVATLPCFVTAAAWVIGSQHAANASYRAGTLDLVLVAAMVAAAFVARNAWWARGELNPHVLTDTRT